MVIAAAQHITSLKDHSSLRLDSVTRNSFYSGDVNTQLAARRAKS